MTQMTDKQKLALSRGRFKRNLLGVKGVLNHTLLYTASTPKDKQELMYLMTKLDFMLDSYRQRNIDLGLTPKNKRNYDII